MRIRNAGFTLIELTVTTAVLGILTGVSVGPIASLVEHRRATAAITSLQTHMALARTAAIARNHAAVLCPSRDGQTCSNGSDWSNGWILFIDANNNRQSDAGDEIVRTELRGNGDGLRIKSSNGRNKLRYRSTGSSAGTNLTISICGRSNNLLGQVIVNNIGRPRSARPPAPTPCPA